MATREEFKLTLSERRKRTFSKSFKREKVRLIEQGSIRVSELCRVYSVSATSVYRWINEYGSGPKIEKLIVEKNSDSKALIDLQRRLAELERLLGQKQIEVEFYKKMIELAEDQYDISIKKNFSTRPSDSSGLTENDTPSV
ncbi:transposase [bacterium]|nr:transposase [bacterium]